MSVASLRKHTDAVIRRLEVEGLAVGDADAKGLAAPYVVVYPIPGRVFGTLENPHEDADLVYQVTCVGSTREQAEWLIDEVMVLLQGVNVAGRSISYIDIDGIPAVEPDRDVSPPVFYGTPRFTLRSTPS